MDFKTWKYCVFLVTIGFLGVALCDEDGPLILEELRDQSSEEKLPETVELDKAEEYRNNITAHMQYLEKYAYMGKSSNDDRQQNIQDPEVLREALIRFQRIAGIPQTGVMDDATAKMMSTPRCGNTDDGASRSSMGRRSKRFAISGSRWGRSPLRYKIVSYPSTGLRRDQVDVIMKDAVEVWSKVTKLDFIKVPNNARADIDVSFSKRQHGDGNAFDGRGGTLAHAFFPTYGGDAHFDDEEQFTHLSFQGTNLFQVAAHEFGHALGLRHSEVRRALMAPFYRGYVPNFQLDRDDILGIQSIYGVRVPPPNPDVTTSTRRPIATPSPSPSPSTSSTSRRPPPSGCNVVFDAVTSNGIITIAFAGSLYYHLDRRGTIGGYPRRIADDFPEVGSNVDAAYITISRSRSGRTVLITLFKDSNFYTYSMVGSRYRYYNSGSTRQAIQDLPSGRIDAMFQWGPTGRIYVFSGSSSYRLQVYHESSRGGAVQRIRVDRTYELSDWGLGPEITRIDSVFQYTNARTYFFIGDRYVRYDDNNYRIDQNANPPYPRSIGSWWTRCRNGNYEQGSSTDAPIDNEDTDQGIQTEETDVTVVRTVEDELRAEANGASHLFYSLTLISTCLFSLLLSQSS